MGKRGRGAGAGRSTTGIVLEFKQAEPFKTITITSKSSSNTQLSQQPTRSGGSPPPPADELDSHFEKLFVKVKDEESLSQLIHQFQKQVERKLVQYKDNKSPNYDEFEKLVACKKLDSTLKKCSGFVRRMKNYSPSQQTCIDAEIGSLNLTKYLAEIVAAIVDTRLKSGTMSDILSICSKLHQRYQEFSSLLLEQYKTRLALKKSEPSIGEVSQVLMDLRLLFEFVTSGIVGDEGLGLIYSSLRNLVVNDKEGRYVSCMVAFVAICGYDLAGILPSKVKELCVTGSIKFPTTNLILPKIQAKFAALFKEYMSSMFQVLLKYHEEVLGSEVYNRKLLKTKGEILKERETAHNDILIKFESFFGLVKRLAYLLDCELPTLRVLEPDPEEDELNALLAEGEENGENGTIICPFDDEETRSFYQDLPDLTKYLTSAARRENALQLEKEAEEVRKAEANLDEEKEIAELESDTLMQEEDDAKEKADAPVLTSESDEKLDDLIALNLTVFLDSLEKAVNTNMIDQAADYFLNKFNNKINRRKLIRTLCYIPRQRLDLIPLWSRLIAVLRPVLPDISSEVVAFLKREFHGMVRKKHQIYIENKLKITKYIAELVNFGIFPPHEAFNCLRILLVDFTHHQLEMACAFIEVCGRYLYKHPNSRRRMKLYIDLVVRKRQAKILEQRYANMIDNALLIVNPPDGKNKRKRPPVIRSFIQEITCSFITRDNLEQAVEYILRLDWNNPKVERYFVKVFTEPWKMARQQLPLNAGLLSDIKKVYPRVVPPIVDSVSERIMEAISNPAVVNNQLIVTLVTYFGELYCYRVIKTMFVFKMLYALISDGVYLDYSSYNPCDPPESTLRIRLVYTLLKVIGPFLMNTNHMRRLRYFIDYYQRYVCWKKEHPYWAMSNKAFPYSVQLTVEDCIFYLFPRMPVWETYEEASKNVQEVEQQLYEKYMDELQEAQEQLPKLPVTSAGLDKIIEEEDNVVEINSATELIIDNGFQISGGSLIGVEIPQEDKRVWGTTEEEILNAKINESEFVEATEEDLQDFDRELEKLMAEATTSAPKEAKQSTSEIRIPMNVHKKGTETEHAPNTIAFAVLMKKGNKQNVKHVDVPEEADVVQQMKRREQAEREERAQLKKLTLGINQIQINEEMAEIEKEMTDKLYNVFKIKPHHPNLIQK